MKQQLILWATWVNADPRRIAYLSFALMITLSLVGGHAVKPCGFAPGGSDGVTGG